MLVNTGLYFFSFGKENSSRQYILRVVCTKYFVLEGWLVFKYQCDKYRNTLEFDVSILYIYIYIYINDFKQMTAFMLHLLVYIFFYFLLLHLSCVFSKFAFVILLYFVYTRLGCYHMLFDSLFLCVIEYFKPLI